MVVHDWGAVGLAFAQRHPERVERAGGDQRGAVPARLPLAPHGADLAHPAAGRAGDGHARRAAPALRSRARQTPRPGRCPRPGSTPCSPTSTRARSARSCACTAARPPDVLAAAGARPGRPGDAGAGGVGHARPLHSRAFAREYAQALPHSELIELPDAGHWRWLDRPDAIERVADFLAAARTGRRADGLAERLATHTTCAPERRAAPRTCRPGRWPLAVADPARARLPDRRSRPPATWRRPRYRSDLFARVGFTLWDNGWYAAHGHWLPGYSLLSPALGALLGVQLLLALSHVAAAGAVRADRRARFRAPARARGGACWFALGFGVGLLSGPRALRPRLRDRPRLGARAAGAVAPHRARPGRADERWPARSRERSWRWRAARWALCARRRARRPAGACARPAAASRARALALARGSRRSWCWRSPFPKAAMSRLRRRPSGRRWRASLLIALLLPQGSAERHVARCARGAHRRGVLYALALIGSFALHTPMGGNAARLGALLAAPLLAACLWERHARWRCCSAGAAAALLAAGDADQRLSRALAGDPSVNASYYAPLLRELRASARTASRAIVEVPLTKAHWEAAYLAGHDGSRWRAAGSASSTRATPRSSTRRARPPGLPRVAARKPRRLRRAARRARSTTPAQAEGALMARGLPYLREVWRSAHWRLFAVAGAAPLAQRRRG